MSRTCLWYNDGDGRSSSTSARYGNRRGREFLFTTAAAATTTGGNAYNDAKTNSNHQPDNALVNTGFTYEHSLWTPAGPGLALHARAEGYDLSWITEPAWRGWRTSPGLRQARRAGSHF